MFSDLQKFADGEFFRSHPAARIRTPEGVTELALLRAAYVSGYEGAVYAIGSSLYAPLAPEPCLEYLEENSLHSAPGGPFPRYVLLSTCYDEPENPLRFVLLYGVKE